MRAETGVGPSIASGSHTWKGNWALLPAAPTKSSTATVLRMSGSTSATFQATKESKKSIVPVSRKMPMMPMRKPWSATRLTRKAFFEASAGARLVYQKPMSR